MSTRDNAPPPEGWVCEPRDCPILASATYEAAPAIPPNIELGDN